MGYAYTHPTNPMLDTWVDDDDPRPVDVVIGRDGVSREGKWYHHPDPPATPGTTPS